MVRRRGIRIIARMMVRPFPAGESLAHQEEEMKVRSQVKVKRPTILAREKAYNKARNERVSYRRLGRLFNAYFEVEKLHGSFEKKMKETVLKKFETGSWPNHGVSMWRIWDPLASDDVRRAPRRYGHGQWYRDLPRFFPGYRTECSLTPSRQVLSAELAATTSASNQERLLARLTQWTDLASNREGRRAGTEMKKIGFKPTWSGIEDHYKNSS